MPNPAPGPLAGVVVLDLSRILAGPYATQLLGDLGAEVIKIERPGQGDDTRAWGPPFLETPEGGRGDAAYYLCANRNKRSVTVDFTSPEGAAIVRDLASRADILFENFKVGALARYGLDYPSLSALNPRLVYVSITGFGQTGPDAHRPGYDFVIQAMTGFMSITGAPDADGGAPMRAGVAIADLFTGLFAANGALAALHHARATGQGQHVDAALYDCAVAALANQATNYLQTGVAPGRIGNGHPNIVPYQAFRALDGDLVLAVGNDAQFRAFCAAAGAQDLLAEPAYATNAGRVAARADLVPRVAALIGARTVSDWTARLDAAGVPCGPVQSIADAFAHPTARARGLVADLARPDGIQTRAPAPPLKLSATPARARTAPPALGADTDSVLSERLGFDTARIADLRARGVAG